MIDLKTATKKELEDFYTENISDELCNVCVYCADCTGHVFADASGSPVYPPCCDNNDCIDEDELRNAANDFIHKFGDWE